MSKGWAIMNCSCGCRTGCVSISVGRFKVAKAVCKQCSNILWSVEVPADMEVFDLASEVERLERKYSSTKPEHVAYMLEFLKARVEKLVRVSKSAAKSLSQKRADMWEKKFLADAIGEW